MCMAGWGVFRPDLHLGGQLLWVGTLPPGLCSPPMETPVTALSTLYSELPPASASEGSAVSAHSTQGPMVGARCNCVR